MSDFIETEGEGAALSLMDVVSDDVDMMETLSTREQVRQLCRLVTTELTEQERQVICLRYGLGGCKANRQREVADRLGISRSYVSRIEKRALEKLRLGLGEPE